MMAPCFNRIVASLLCAEDVRENEWEGNAGSSNGDLPGCKQRGKTFLHMPLIEDDEFVALLMQKEDRLMKKIKEYIVSYQGAEVRLRARVVNWMLDVHAYYRFSSRTAFLSLSYFDQFLSKHANTRGKAWLLQLVAIGSISLAAKLEETEVPLLLDLQVGDIEHVFEPCTIQRMELLIMSTLNWEMSSVTPFSYLHYLLHKTGFPDGLSQSLIARSEELILLSCRDFRFLAHSPSVVAVASLVWACKDEMPLQAARLQQALTLLWPVKEIEATEWACLMDEMLRGGDLPNKGALWKSSVPQSPMGVLDAACFSTGSCDLTLNTSSSTAICASRSECMRSSVNMSNHVSHPYLTPNGEIAASPTSALPPQLPPKRKKLNEQSTHTYKSSHS